MTNYLKLFASIIIVAAGLSLGFIYYQSNKLTAPALLYQTPVSSPNPKIKTVLPKEAATPPGPFIPDPKLGIYTPILMYHHIALKRPQASYYVSPGVFDSQMKWLSDNGYKVISMDDLISGLKGTTTLPTKPTIITFDDGTVDQYANVLPILKKYGYTATFYIISGEVGSDGYMDWSQIKELVNNGMTIGAHSVTHPNLTHLTSTQLESELANSKKVIEKNLGITVKHFCYPGGAHNQVVVEKTAQYYISATTTIHKAYHNIKSPNDFYRLERIHIDDEMPSFIDWIRGINLF
ncbi:MAG TPA: polysaccharide deacetylase family protein [Patescibacteria group bacterium]